MIDEPYLPFFTSLVTDVAKNLVGSGELDARNLSEGDFIAALRSKLRDLQDEGAFEPVLIELDHLHKLLEHARAAAKEDDFNYAIVFYATWVEHWLNMMIAWRAREDGCDDAGITELIRSTSFHAKTGSYWRNTFGEPLDDVGLLRDLGHLRNDFLHYKWQPFPVDEERRFDREGDRIAYLARIEGALARLLGVEDRLRYPGWTPVLEKWTVDSIDAAQTATADEIDAMPGA